MARRSNTDAVWIDVLPAMPEFGRDLSKGATGAGKKAGEAVAIELEKVVERAGRQAGQTLGRGIAAAQARVDDLGAALETARRKEANAAGLARVAEQKLNEARAKGDKITGSQLAAAEEKLAAARRAVEGATTQVTRVTRQYEQAQLDAAEATDDADESVRRSDEGLRDYVGRMDSATRSSLAFAVGAYRAAAGAAALGSSVPALGALGAALASAAGAGLVLPGIMTAGLIGVGALRIGVVGLADAFEAAAEGDATKLAEATAELAPGAQALVGQYVRLRPAIDDLRLAVQARLFADIGDEVENLAGDYLPAARRGLVDMAGNFNTAGKNAAAFLREQRTIADLPVLFDRSNAAVADLTTTVGPLLSVLRDISVVSAEVTADLTGGAGEAARGWAAFIAEARETGQLEAWIRGGLDVLGEFLAVGGNVASIFGAIFGAAEVAGGGGVLGTVQQVTGTIAALLQSEAGFAALVAFFTTVRGVVTGLLPGLQGVAAALFEVVTIVGPELPGVAEGFSAAAVALTPLAVDLARLAAVILPPLAELILWLSPALPVLAAGFLAGSVALRGYLIVSRIVGLYKAWVAGQIALNVAMSANPVGIIVVAIVALVGAFIYLWNNSEGFRDFWIGLWESIQSAALWAYENVVKPVFDGIVAGALWVADAAVWLKDAAVGAWEGIAAAATWLWQTVLRPVFDALSFAARLLAAIIVTVLVTPVVLAFKALAAAGSWLWTNVLQPVFGFIGAAVSVLWSGFIAPAIDRIVGYVRVWAAIFSWLWEAVVSRVVDAIGTAISWLWSNVVQPVIGFVVAYVQAWGAVFSWLWTNAVQPALSAIGIAFSWLHTNVIVPVGAAISGAVAAVGDTFSWVWSSIIQPVWNALGTAISWVWETLIRPAFDAITSAVGSIGSAFDTAVNGIELAWNRVYDILSTPIKWIIDVVYNQGIREVWNKVAGLVGLGALPALTFGGGSAKGGRQQHMAHGGVLPGYAPGVDSIPVLASPGEGWLVPEAVRGLGPAFVGWANRHFSGGRSDGGVGTGGPAGFARGGVVQRFADGGVVGNILNWVSGIGEDVIGLWKDPIGYIKSRSGAAGSWSDLLAETPAKLIGDAASWLWREIKSFFGFSSDQAAAAAGAAGGRPSGWAQMWDIIRAQFPSATLNSAFRPGDPGYHGKGRAIDIGGPMGAINPWIAKVYPDSTQLIYTPGVNLLNGAPFRYDAPTQADHFDHIHWAFDQGGYLPTGHSLVYNGTGDPEPVLTTSQFDALTGAAAAGGGGFNLTQHIHPRPEQSEEQIGAASTRQAKFAFAQSGIGGLV